VKIRGSKGEISNVRILGPTRRQTQVEISRTDSFVLGLNPPIRDSGDLSGSAPITITGPKGRITLSEGCIIAQRHIHMLPEDTQRFKVSDGELVRIKTLTLRKVIFENVLIRVNKSSALECHLDTDEANACDLKNRDEVRII